MRLPPAAAIPRQLTLANGRTLDCSGWNGRWPVDCWRPLQTTCADASVRAYALSPDWWSALGEAVKRRAAFSLDVLAPIEFVEHGGGAIVFAPSVFGAVRPLADAPAGVGELGALQATLAACSRLAAAAQALHRAGLVWLTFDPVALEQGPGGMRIANLDLVLCHAGACPDGLPLRPAYASPEACAFHAEAVGPATDVYHLGLYAYYALANFLPDGLPGLGPQAFDFRLPPLRIYRPELLPGVAGVIERATATAPADRYPAVAEFLDALKAAVEIAQSDAAEPGRNVALGAGGATAAGRMHVLAGLPNQDAFAIHPLANGTLAVIADGVTHVAIGSGEIASRLAIESLARLPAALAAAASPAQVESALVQAFRSASAAILSSALLLADEGPIEPTDMMCTTALVAVVRGDQVALASVGDSRAFLVRDGWAEQLTVDGDVRSVALATGTPPEEVEALGPAAGSLVTCLGVGEPGPDGRLAVCPLRGAPTLSHFRVRPGDVLVLATDGLVEEGAFLERHELAALVSRHDEEDARSLAERLVAAAQARHRDSSDDEPEGFGDDVTCVVLRVRASEP